MVFTIGHSTHSPMAFVELLRSNGIRRVVDVRRAPGSRRMPHFGKQPLSQILAEQSVDYVHEPALGGRRRPAPDSVNTAWRNSSFRGYADHMSSAEFASALERLEALAGERPTAIMCAEALWWHCHRRLIADALAAHGWHVRHVPASGAAVDHVMTPFATVVEGRLLYAAVDGAVESG